MSTYLIGIAGPSCSGKSEVARRLARILHAPIIPLDHYYKDLGHLSFEQRVPKNFDSPEALDAEMIIDHVRRLKNGYPIEKPTYDFANHVRAPDKYLVEPGDFVIVEGLFALYWSDVTELLDTKVYIDAEHDICLERRIFRDVRERCRTEQSVRTQYAATVAPMCELYVAPGKLIADIVLSGTDPVKQSVYTILNHIAATSRDAPRREIARAGLRAEIDEIHKTSA